MRNAAKNFGWFILSLGISIAPLSASTTNVVSKPIPRLGSNVSDPQAARVRQLRDELKAYRAHAARVLEAVKERLQRLQARDARAAHLERHLEKEVAHLQADALKAMPSALKSDLRGVLNPKDVKAVLEMEGKLGSIHDELWELMDLQLKAADGTTASTIAKVQAEIVDFTNQVAICDAFLAGLDKQLAAPPQVAADRNPGSVAPPKASSNPQPRVSNGGSDEARARAGETVANAAGRGGAAGSAGGSSSSSGGSKSDNGSVTVRDVSTGRTGPTESIAGPANVSGNAHGGEVDHDGGEGDGDGGPGGSDQN